MDVTPCSACTSTGKCSVLKMTSSSGDVQPSYPPLQNLDLLPCKIHFKAVLKTKFCHFFGSESSTLSTFSTPHFEPVSSMASAIFILNSSHYRCWVWTYCKQLPCPMVMVVSGSKPMLYRVSFSVQSYKPVFPFVLMWFIQREVGVCITIMYHGFFK